MLYGNDRDNRDNILNGLCCKEDVGPWSLDAPYMFLLFHLSNSEVH